MPIVPLPPINPATPVAAPSSTPTKPSGGAGFGEALANELGKLDGLQQQASSASQALATGQATDVSAVVMQVEQASLALQLAAQVRNKAVDAYQELFRMQV
jgi:flagellar hook-basal body complex protein FliE